MALTIFNAQEYSKRLKVTIQSTGKLGFSDETIKTLKLSAEKFIRIAHDDQSGQLYLAITSQPSLDAFKVCAAGAYFYLNTAILFDKLEMDYRTQTIICDLKRCEQFDQELDGEVYSMTPRKRANNKKEEE